MLKTNLKPGPSPAKTLGELPVGAFLKDMRTAYNDKPIIWRIADKNHEGYPENSVTLFSHMIITLKAVDAQEPTTPLTSDGWPALTAERGNGRYMLSNIRAWANSDAKAGQWFTKTHEYDDTPARERVYQQSNPYDDHDGFLTHLSPRFRNALMPTTLSTMVSNDFGGGTDVCVDKIFLPTLFELGLDNDTQTVEGVKLEIFADEANRMAYPTPECVARNEYNMPNLDVSKVWMWWSRSTHSRNLYMTYVVNLTNKASTYQAYYSVIGFRPFCNIPMDTGVSLLQDVDGSYILFP